MILFTRPQWANPFGSMIPTYLPEAIAVKILERLLLCLVISVSLVSLLYSVGYRSQEAISLQFRKIACSLDISRRISATLWKSLASRISSISIRRLTIRKLISSRKFFILFTNRSFLPHIPLPSSLAYPATHYFHRTVCRAIRFLHHRIPNPSPDTADRCFPPSSQPVAPSTCRAELRWLMPTVPATGLDALP